MKYLHFQDLYHLTNFLVASIYLKKLKKLYFKNLKTNKINNKITIYFVGI